MIPRKFVLSIPLFMMAVILMNIAVLLSFSSVEAAPLNQSGVPLEISVGYDIGVINGLDVDIHGASILILENRPGGAFDHNFLHFDTSAIPANATVTEAALELNMSRISGPPDNPDQFDVELGVVMAEWPGYPFRWADQPLVNWTGTGQQISALGLASWPLTSLVQSWVDGTLANNGIALRGTTAGGVLEAQTSDAPDDPKTDDDGFPPRLVVTYIASSDLGDAPDSTSHYTGTTMFAYSGKGANFPTVFDPSLLLASGPIHHQPQQLHLGPGVSSEVEADIGPDGDGVNNIAPPADMPDQDLFDDGSQLTLQAHCNPGLVNVAVNVSVAAAQHFSGTQETAFLNIWVDWNHDGRWDGGGICASPGGANTDVVEHILIDYPIDVAMLGPGLHSITGIQTGRIPWPTQYKERSRWVRFTLSDVPSNKTLQFNGIKHGDGRGYRQPFHTGETEDYLLPLHEGLQDD